MIADCAVDPEVFAEWQHFKSLYEDFGVHRGRLISLFPRKRWMRTVADTARKYVADRINTEMQATRIEERLRSERFRRKTKPPGGREYPGDGTSWLEAACNAQPEFDLIIGRRAGSSAASVAIGELMKDEPPFFRRSQVPIRRRKEDLVSAFALLLGWCDELVLVDPNLRADEVRFSATIIHLIERWQEVCDRGRVPKRFEIHTARVRNPKDRYLRGPQMGQWKSHIAPYLPSGWSLKVCYWDRLPAGGRPHARFLLTELGGLHYDNGLDEGDGETLVTLLEDEAWGDAFKRFNSGCLPADFDPAEHSMEFR